MKENKKTSQDKEKKNVFKNFLVEVTESEIVNF